MIEENELMQDNKRLLHAFNAILDKTDGYARFIDLTNSGLSIVQAIHKISEDRHG